MALQPGTAPSANFDLSDWKITLPVDSKGSISGTAVEVTNLSGYQNSKYFYTGTDGAMVFSASVDGATTSGSKYARSELREMDDGERAAWNLKTGGFMSATLEVDKAPIKSDGTTGRLVVGQIHGHDEELVRLYWDNGTVYFVNDQAGSGNKETTFKLADSSGKNPNVSLNEKFSYSIDAHDDVLDVRVYADGQEYKSVTKINDVWDSDAFYFKAGAYLGVNEDTGSGSGQTSFYSLGFNHDGTTTVPMTPPPTETAPETPPSTPSAPKPPTSTPSTPDTTKTFDGTSKADTISGKDSNDLIRGAGGDDKLYGKQGNDVLTGGAGKDYFTFDTKANSKTNVDMITDFNVKDDTIRMNDTAFGKLKSGNLSSSQFVYGSEAVDKNDYVIYNEKTGALFYDEDGSGSKAAVQFATVQNHAHLTASDFLII
ncbi:polysaccharide lyase family 7 protein [Flaviflagellibacter deserti]|uniref:Polysaccharide lyase family 7 protein n=1 Tax=Flaviflagellibacter deserti TaxID=2267266 RepID=A0ABV9Z0R3_9HYPH